MTPKEEIEMALARAVHAVIVEHAVRAYMDEAGAAATADDAPLVRAKVREIYDGIVK